MNINLVVIKTNQPENLVAFYEQLGFQFSNHRHGTGPLHVAAELPNFVFEIYPLPADINTPDNTTRLGFTIPDLEASLNKLREHGNSRSIKKEPMVAAWGRRRPNLHGKWRGSKETYRWR